MTLPRRGLREDAPIEGVGLFTEARVRCTIRPGHAGQGIVFRRIDLPSAPAIPVSIDALTGQPVHPAFAAMPPRHTGLCARHAAGALVYTTEHVLAALAGLGITDAQIDLDGPELPIGDGSAQPFTDAIARAGLTELAGHAEPLVVREPIRVASPDGRAWVAAEPITAAESPSYHYRLDYGPAAPIPAHTASWSGDPDAFLRDIAPARTFSLAAEAEQMRALGLFKSFSPRDLPVIAPDGGLIDNAWRHEAEPARHKLLDLIGDLALVGRPLHARIVAERAGHALNHALARALVQAQA